MPYFSALRPLWTIHLSCSVLHFLFLTLLLFFRSSLNNSSELYLTLLLWFRSSLNDLSEVYFTSPLYMHCYWLRQTIEHNRGHLETRSETRCPGKVSCFTSHTHYKCWRNNEHVCIKVMHGCRQNCMDTLDMVSLFVIIFSNKSEPLMYTSDSATYIWSMVAWAVFNNVAASLATSWDRSSSIGRNSRKARLAKVASVAKVFYSLSPAICKQPSPIYPSYSGNEF